MEVKCVSCRKPVNMALVVSGELVCGECYERLVAGAAKIAEYNAAVDMVAASKRKKDARNKMVRP